MGQVICITVSLCALQIESKILPLTHVKTAAVIETSESAGADIKKEESKGCRHGQNHSVGSFGALEIARS
jgi:hypothetical protein